MRLVVGLGNPGERYRRTRHNIGFMVIDALGARAGVRRGRTEAEAWVAEADVADERVLLVKPQTFMNRSGQAVEPLLRRYGAGPVDLLVVLDDVALELNQLRIRERGSHGGHNGLRSLIESLGSEEFPRVRVGVRRGESPADLADYVLSGFAVDEVLIVQEMVGRACDAVGCFVREGAQTAMNRFNRRESA
jgi:PTH1 family peptidyl-tRNA hydrolase